MKMYTLGHTFMPSRIHAGGLRYHGDAASLSQLYDRGVIEARAYTQVPVFEAAVTFARTEGILPAPESAHAIKATVELANECKQSGERKTIVFNLSGHGHFDLGAYDAYLAGELEEIELSDAKIQESLAALPAV